MPKFQIETRRGFKYEIETDDESELDGIVGQIETDEDTEFSKSRPLPDGVTPTVESAGGGRGFVNPALPAETPRMGGRRGGTRPEAKPFVAQGEPELLDRKLPAGQTTPESNQDPLLRPEYVDSVRAKVGSLAPEKRMAELQRMAAGKTVEARAAREALRQVGYEAQRITPADEELARSIGPRTPAPTMGSGGSKKTSVPSIEPSIRDIEQGQTPAQIAARRDTAAGVADANQGIDAITQRNLRLDAANTSTLRRGADLGVAAAGGAVTGFKLISDAFGAGNQMSQALEGVGNLIDRARSAASVQDDQTIDRLMKEAEDGGVGDQVLAAARAFSVKPAEFIAQGLGTSVPAILAALLPGVRESAIAGIVAATTSGAAMGAGTIKGGIYDEVKKDLRARGMSADEAETRAKAAQAYTGDNAGQIAIGAVLGGLASATGQEGVALNMIKRVMGREGAKVAAKEATGGLIGAALKGGAVEAVPEFLQGGQEQLAKNLALVNEGADVPAMRGVFGQGALEGLAGLGSGAAVSALEYRGTPGQQFAGALNADIAGTAVNQQAIDDQVRRALDPNSQAGAGIIASAARAETNFTPADSTTRAAGLVDVVLPISEVPDVGVPVAAGAVAAGGGAGLGAQPVGGLADSGPGAAVDGGVGVPAAAPARPGAAGAPVRTGAAGGVAPALTDPVARTSDADLLARVGAPPAAPPEIDKAAQKEAAKAATTAEQKAQRADEMLRAAEALGEPDTIEVARRVQQRAQADLASAQQRAAAMQPKETTTNVPTTSELGAQAREAGAPQEQGQGQATPAGEQGAGGAAGAAADLTGGEWQAFAPETGTKAVPRAEMPQIKAEHRGALTQFLGARGVTHEQVELTADELKPTQAEFSPAKVQSMGGADIGRSILVSSDGYVLDGHHQWLAAKESGQPVKAIRLDAPMDELLPMAREFPSSTLEAGATEVEAQASPARAAAASESLAGPQRTLLDGSLRAIERSRNTTYGETSKLVLAEDPTPDEQAAIAFAEANGVKVAIVEETGKSGFNGAAINGINVLVRGENNDQVLSVAVHEGIHTLDDDIKGALISAIKPTLRNRDAFQRIYRYGSGAEARAKMTTEERAAEDAMITEEMVAMLGQSEAKRPEFWGKLATKMGDTAFGKFARHILGKLDSMMGKYVASEKIVRDAWTTDLPLVQNALAEAYAGQLKRRGLSKDAERAVAQYVSQDRAAQFSQRAYHGTPQKGIEKFDTKKIGTGEGAQAFGHGLYFASKREVADHYRKTLSRGARLDGQKVNTTSLSFADDSMVRMFANRGVAGLSDDAARSQTAEWAKGNKQVTERYTPKQIDEFVARLGTDSGQLYEVEVPDDGDMLLWDKPLSEQPEKVRAALAAIDPDNYDQGGDDFDAAEPGQMVYERLKSTAGGDKAASEALMAAGIKGIKYLDGTSRGSAGGSYNFVVFNSDDVEIKGVQFSSAATATEDQLADLKDRKITIDVDTGDGKTAKMTMGAADAVRDIQARIEAAKKLVGCLK